MTRMTGNPFPAVGWRALAAAVALSAGLCASLPALEMFAAIAAVQPAA